MGKIITFPALQIWVDPAYPKAYQDINLINYLTELNETKLTYGLIRFNIEHAITLMPPNSIMNSSDLWIETPEIELRKSN